MSGRYSRLIKTTSPPFLFEATRFGCLRCRGFITLFHGSVTRPGRIERGLFQKITRMFRFCLDAAVKMNTIGTDMMRFLPHS